MKKIISLVLALVMCLSLCACGKSQAVKDVEEAINAIGEVSLDSEEAILKAERMYDYLTDSEKSNVENKGVLVEARYAYDRLYTDTIYNTAKEAYELLCEGAEIYTFIAHNLNNVGKFGANSNIYTMDDDFCKCFSEATHDIFRCPALTEQEAKDALAFYYNEKGLSGSMPADQFFCMNLFNRAYVDIRGYHTKAIMEEAGVLLLNLKDTYNDEKYYSVLQEFFDYVATGTEAFSKVNNFTTLSTWTGEYQSQYLQYQQKIDPMFVD